MVKHPKHIRKAKRNSTHPFVLSGQEPSHKRVMQRNRKERRFKYYGLAAIILALMFLALLLGSIVNKGTSAFSSTEIALNVTLDPERLGLTDPNYPRTVKNARYRRVIQDALEAQFPEVQTRTDKRMLHSLVSWTAQFDLREEVLKDPELIGNTARFWFPAASDIDLAQKGTISRAVPEIKRRVKDIEFGWLDTLEQKNALKKRFNTRFFTESDSREPESAGIWGALLGSLLVIGVCLAVSFPIAICAAVYLEEFAPKNKWTDAIEVALNNLAAVPSIVYGLLGLSVFLNFLHLPRSASLVGGLTLSLLVLPTIVITARNALKSVPPSIKDAAIGLGASPIQVMMHHTLPLSMPGIMTGTILATARAMGETAPLLMIGMVAFINAAPGGLTDPATVLPVQIYLWADSPELGFVEKTSAAIMILLGFLIVANTIAVYIRNKYEKDW